MCGVGGGGGGEGVGAGVRSPFRENKITTYRPEKSWPCHHELCIRFNPSHPIAIAGLVRVRPFGEAV